MDVSSSIESEDITRNIQKTGLLSQETVAKTTLKQSKIRWLQLVLIILLQLGNFYCQDGPSYLKQQIMDQFSLSETVTFSPGIISPLFGGFLIDKIGVRPCNTMFTIIITLGMGIQAIGCLVENFNVFLVGRVVFGISADGLTVSQYKMCSKWFQGQELALALSFKVTMGRLGSVIASITLYQAYQINDNVFYPMLISTIISGSSIIFGIFANILDYKSDKEEGIFDKQGQIAESDKFQLKYLKDFSALYWSLVATTVLFFNCLIPFFSNLQTLLTKRYAVPKDLVGSLQSTPFLVATFIAPLIGLAIDKFGKRTYLLVFSGVIGIFAHTLFLIIPDCPDGSCSFWIILAPLMLLALYYAVFGSVAYPCVTMLCKKSMLGTGFGCLIALTNGMQAGVGPIAGKIIDDTVDDRDGYFFCEILFLAIATAGFLFSILTFILDWKNGKVLFNNFSNKFSDKTSQRFSQMSK